MTALSQIPAPVLAAEEVIGLETRPGVVQSFLLRGPRHPGASVILLPGGDGNLELSKKLIGRGDTNFLVRTRSAFEEHGFQVAVIDAPSDRKPAGMLDGFRTSAEHVCDVEVVAQYLKARVDVPLWLIGTSRGTESAAHVAIHCGQAFAGLVLASAVSAPATRASPVTSMQLDALTIPVLIVAHRDDECGLSPASGAERIRNALVRSPRAEIQYFEGGHPPRSRPCEALSTHGFLGIESDVVDAIAAFIKACDPMRFRTEIAG